MTSFPQFPVGSCPFQVQRSAGGPRDLQHSRLGVQAAPAVPGTPGPDAVHRRGSQRVDPGVPASVPTPPLELQHIGPGQHVVRPGDAAK